MKRKMLVADLLCGAGGSSTGCARAMAALGLDMELVCVNHWPTAIETHRINHPEARHYVQDIATVRPHILVPEGYLDLLMASPTCTHHSVARGGKPTSDQQRSDPWHIVTWLTELRVKRIIIENVWEFISWGPVDARTHRPIASRRGEYFRAWIDTLRRLGFDVEWRKLNAADYGDATTRQRFILMGRSDGKPIVWPEPTHHRRTDGLALFPGVKPWRPAREIIDWQLRGRSIFDRKKPLAPKTLARIYAGAVKFGWPEPFLVVLRNHMGGASVDQPLATIAARGTHIGLAQPIILSQQNSGAPRSAGDPLPTITCGGGGAEKRQGCARHMIAEPVVINGRKNNRAKAVSQEPLPTLDTKGGVWLAEPRVEPFILSRQGGGAPRDVDEPTPTQCAKHSHALIAPFYGSGSGLTSKSIEQPLDTVTAKDRFGLVVPAVILTGHGEREGQAPRCHSSDDPTPTITSQGLGVVVPVAHEGGLNRAHSVDAPLPTIATGNRGSEGFAQGVITPVFDGERYDILFRMLEPHELAAAMGFTSEDQEYEFAGTKTEQIKQIGNAVSVAKMKACVSAIMADAARKPKAEKPALVVVPRAVEAA